MVRSGHDQTGSSRSSPATELCHVDIMRLPAWTPEPAGRPATPPRRCVRLVRSVLENAAHELHDDLTMMLVEYRAGTTS
jgi:hypothetical protein